MFLSYGKSKRNQTKNQSYLSISPFVNTIILSFKCTKYCNLILKKEEGKKLSSLDENNVHVFSIIIFTACKIPGTSIWVRSW